MANFRTQLYEGCLDCCLCSVQSLRGKIAMFILHANISVYTRLSRYSSRYQRTQTFRVQLYYRIHVAETQHRLQIQNFE